MCNTPVHHPVHHPVFTAPHLLLTSLQQHREAEEVKHWAPIRIAAWHTSNDCSLAYLKPARLRQTKTLSMFSFLSPAFSAAFDVLSDTWAVQLT